MLYRRSTVYWLPTYHYVSHAKYIVFSWFLSRFTHTHVQMNSIPGLCVPFCVRKYWWFSELLQVTLWVPNEKSLHFGCHFRFRGRLGWKAIVHWYWNLDKILCLHLSRFSVLKMTLLNLLNWIRMVGDGFHLFSYMCDNFSALWHRVLKNTFYLPNKTGKISLKVNSRGWKFWVDSLIAHTTVCCIHAHSLIGSVGRF